MTSPSGPTGKSPSSKARWVSSGGMTLRAAPMSTSTTVVTCAAACAANSSEMRRKRCGIFGASALRALRRLVRRCGCALPYLPVCRPARPCMLMDPPHVAPATRLAYARSSAVRSLSA